MHLRSTLLAFTLTGLACGGASSATFCSNFCPSYVGCEQSHGEASGKHSPLPLFCDNTSLCQSNCTDAADGLGETEADFLRCGNCVLQYIGNKVCDADKTQTTGQVSCPDECSKIDAAGRKFRDDFTAAFGKGSTSCPPGEQSWPASDPILSHGVGGAGPGGSWVCNDNCSSGTLMFGPYVALPPGSYRAGFRDVRARLADGAQVTADVSNPQAGNSKFANATLSASDLVDGQEIAMTFTLTEQQSEVEVRLWAQGMLSIGSVFITKLQ
jgi:hypothetical protein